MRWFAGVASLALVSACGRLGFDDQPAGTADAATDAEQDAARDAPAAVAISYVQTGGSANGAATVTVTAPFPSDVQAGDVLIIGTDWDTLGSATSRALTDSQGNTYVDAVPSTGGCCYQILSYAVAGQSGPDSVTATLNAPANDYLELHVLEYAGMSATDPFDVGSVGTGQTGSAVTIISAPPLVTSGSNELLVGYFTAGAGEVGLGSGFVARSTLDADLVEDAPAAVRGTYTVSATTDAAAGWTGCAGAFR